MQAVTLKDAKRNLSRLVDQVLADGPAGGCHASRRIQFVERKIVFARQSGQCGAFATIGGRT